MEGNIWVLIVRCRQIDATQDARGTRRHVPWKSIAMPLRKPVSPYRHFFTGVDIFSWGWSWPVSLVSSSLFLFSTLTKIRQQTHRVVPRLSILDGLVHPLLEDSQILPRKQCQSSHHRYHRPRRCFLPTRSHPSRHDCDC